MSESNSIQIDLFEPVWQRQPKESTRWYDRFYRYMVAGPKRSFLGTYNAELAEKGGKRRTSIPRAWDEAIDRFCWEERATAWDDYQRSIDREKWERRFQELRENAWEMSREHLRRHEQMLKVPLFEQVTTRNDAGNPVAITIKPVKWSYKDLITTSSAVLSLGAFAIGDVQAAEELLGMLGYTVTVDGESESVDVAESQGA